MSKRSLKLLILTILCGVVPISGAEAPALAEPMRLESNCPYAHATAAEREAASAATVRLNENAPTGMFDSSHSAQALLP